MLRESCPGSREIRSPYPEEIRCVFCGSTCEIWSDENEAVCKSCGKTISREMPLTCIQWCPAAKECIGAEKFDRLMGKDKMPARKPYPVR
ncbi:MAG: hypothetical protein HY805_10385 [Nitrospirae bacterium]|nr:hypothetical protein [Nitrospirota bacterium]